MTLRGLGSSTGTAPDHQTNPSRSDFHDKSASKVSENRKSMPIKSRSAVIDSIEAPSRSRSRNLESLLNDTSTGTLGLGLPPSNPSKKSSKHKSARRSKSESGLNKEKASRSATKKKSRKSSRKSASAVSPRRKSGLMLLNEKIGNSAVSNIPGVNSAPMNGRVFGCVFFIGKTATPDANKHEKKDKRKAGKDFHKKRRGEPKDRKERKAGGNKDGEKRREQEKRVEERYAKRSEVELRDMAPAVLKTSEAGDSKSASFNAKASGSERDDKTDPRNQKRSDEEEYGSYQDKTLCKVEISGKKKDQIPSLVVKVSAKKRI